MSTPPLDPGAATDDGAALPVRRDGGDAPAAAPSSPHPVANRERVAEVLREFGHPTEHDGWVLFADELDDFYNALLAAGVFREEATVKAAPTREEIAEVMRIDVPDCRGSCHCAWHHGEANRLSAADAVLALLDGGES